MNRHGRQKEGEANDHDVDVVDARVDCIFMDMLEDTGGGNVLGLDTGGSEYFFIVVQELGRFGSVGQQDERADTHARCDDAFDQLRRYSDTTRCERANVRRTKSIRQLVR